MMFRYSLHQETVAAGIEAAVSRVLAEGVRTADIARDQTGAVGTAEMGDRIVDALRQVL